MKQLLEAQYEMVRGSRTVLLDYCEAIEPHHFLFAHPGFGKGGSIRNLLVHIGNTYEGWLTQRALQRDFESREYESINTVASFRTWAKTIDEVVREFLKEFQNNYMRELRVSLNESKTIVSSPLQLFTHVITHEYHHKGQILSISRHLGYTPVDTDIMR